MSARREPFAIEVEEGVAPGVEAQEGVVAAAESAEGGVEGFDGGEADSGVGVDLRVAGVGGLPAGGDGAGFDGFHRAAHFGGVPPIGIEQQEGVAGIGGREGGGVGRQQQMAGQVEFLFQGVGLKFDPGGSPQGTDAALARVFAAADQDEDGGAQVYGAGSSAGATGTSSGGVWWGD